MCVRLFATQCLGPVQVQIQVLRLWIRFWYSVECLLSKHCFSQLCPIGMVWMYCIYLDTYYLLSGRGINPTTNNFLIWPSSNECHLKLHRIKCIGLLWTDPGLMDWDGMITLAEGFTFFLVQFSGHFLPFEWFRVCKRRREEERVCAPIFISYNVEPVV